MILLNHLGIPRISIWIDGILDAGLMALVTIFSISWVVKREFTVVRESYIDELMPVKAALIVFALQLSMMFLLQFLPLELNVWQEAIFDSIIFGVCSTIAIYVALLIHIKRVRPGDEKIKYKISSIKYYFSVIYAIILILLLSFLTAIYQQQAQDNLNARIANNSKSLNTIKNRFYALLDFTAKDILRLSKDPDAIGAFKGDRVNINTIQQRYRDLIAVTKSYTQARLIDIDGNEIIRVHLNNDSIHVVPDDQLQNKSDRYYIKEGTKLNDGEIYVSPMDLNVEHGIVETPYRPTIRALTPVVDDNNSTKGFLVINMMGNEFLDILSQETGNVEGDLMLVNADGYWLYGNKPETNWAFMFPEKSSPRFRFQYEYPEAWHAIEMMGQHVINEGDSLFIISTINGSKDDIHNEWGINIDSDARHYSNLPKWFLVNHINTDSIRATLDNLRQHLSALFIVLSILLAVVVFTLSSAQISKAKAVTD